MSFSSAPYWEKRYVSGGFSGAGSRGIAAEFKANTINYLLSLFEIKTVLDMGCGDGYLTGLIKADQYVGVDVSRTAIAKCKAAYPDRRFIHIDEGPLPVSDAVLSLDVVFHLVEDEVFQRYVSDVFNSAEKLVIFYSTNHENNAGFRPHVRNRLFVDWIENNVPEWHLHSKIQSPIDDKISPSDFFIFTPS